MSTFPMFTSPMIQPVAPVDSSFSVNSVSVDGVDSAIHELQQRELLEPLLLLSAGYCALPLILQPLLLLLAPFAEVLGVTLDTRKPHDLP